MNSYITAALTIALALPAAAQAKTLYQDIHDFAGAPGDGDTPLAELVADSQGRLYGTTTVGGTAGNGTLYRLTLPATKTQQGTIEILHSFQAGEGQTPLGGVLIGADGGLYGTTAAGGAFNFGTIYRVDPNDFTLRKLHDFNRDAGDGEASHAGLTAGPKGLLYGTTSGGGSVQQGTVFAISPQGDTVSYAVIHNFTAVDDGSDPFYGRLLSHGNNLFGTTILGGNENGFGAAFELSLSKGVWTETIIHEFGSGQNDALHPADNLVMGKAGTLYGCAQGESTGVVFSLAPAGAGAPWTETILRSFVANAGQPLVSECGLAMDKTGRLIGTSSGGGKYGFGTVFTLTPAGGGWALAVVHSFNTGGDGWDPVTNLLGVAHGYYVGTAYMGGANGIGTVYRIKP